MIKLTNLNRVFRTQDVETTALSEINLTVNEGEFVPIMGLFGCGKSTLLSILGMLTHHLLVSLNLLDRHRRLQKLSQLRRLALSFKALTLSMN